MVNRDITIVAIGNSVYERIDSEPYYVQEGERVYLTQREKIKLGINESLNEFHYLGKRS